MRTVVKIDSELAARSDAGLASQLKSDQRQKLCELRVALLEAGLRSLDQQARAERAMLRVLVLIRREASHCCPVNFRRYYFYYRYECEYWFNLVVYQKAALP